MFRLITLGCFVLSIFLAIGTTAFSATNNNYEMTQILSTSKNVANMMRREGGREEYNRLMARVIPVERLFKQGIMVPERPMVVALLRLRAEVLYRNATLNIGGLAYYAPAKNTKKEIQLLQFVNRLQYQLHNIEKRINKVLGDRK